MANLNDVTSKSAIELVDDYLVKLNRFIEDYNTSISKTRDNLLNCIESNKKSTQNSAKRCNQTIQEIDAQIKALIPKYSAENEKIQEKNEARISSNNETIEEYKKEYKENIAEENKKYDQVVNEENDRLENLQHLNRKELQHYVQQIDAEEITQKRELESTIDGLLLEIKSIQERLKEDIDDLRHNYLIKSSGYNEEMRKTRNEFIEKEKELRTVSREETTSHHKQIEELTKESSVKQKNILNTFSNDFLNLSNEDDKILLENADDHIKLLSLQASNKEKKRILEIEKDHNLLLEKEKDNTKIRNLKILKQDIDNQNATRINKENVYSLMRISEFEKDSLLSDAIKENKISGLSLDSNATINRLHEKLNDKKNDLDFFVNRFTLLRDSKRKTIELYSHLYDITTTLVLDLNQLERENVLEHHKVILDKKIENINYLNKVSEYECNKELASNNLKQNLETIDLEIKKINATFDNTVFKTRSSYNTEKTRIEHIYTMFETKFNAGVKTIENDVNFILVIISKLKEDLVKTLTNAIDEIKKEKENPEKIGVFFKMMNAEIQYLQEHVESYYSDKDLRFTPDVDEIINDYLNASIQKKKEFEKEFRELTNKTQLIETEIKEIENDIYMLEASKHAYLEKNKRFYDERDELRDFEEQIDEKSFRLHILKLRLKSQAKDMTNLENEMSRIDEGEALLSKKENKKLYELDFSNQYYEKYDELQEIIENMFKQLYNIVEESMQKLTSKSLYSYNSATLKVINKTISSIKDYSYRTTDEYKNEFKKISKACANSLEKVKKTFDFNFEMINRERNIALDEEQSKIIISKKNSRDLETKYSFDIINLKEDSEERLRDLDLYLSDYDRKYDIQVAALESNSMSMRKYYDDAITFETKNRLAKLADLYRQRKESKLNYENNLARLNTNYEIEKEKNTNQAKNRINNVIKQYMQKSMDYDMQLKGLDELLKKSSIECNNAIIDSDLQLTDFIKKLDNSKQNDIKKAKDEIGKKLKHDIKKYKLELENKNGTTS